MNDRQVAPWLIQAHRVAELHAEQCQGCITSPEAVQDFQKDAHPDGTASTVPASSAQNEVQPHFPGAETAAGWVGGTKNISDHLTQIQSKHMQLQALPCASSLHLRVPDLIVFRKWDS